MSWFAIIIVALILVFWIGLGWSSLLWFGVGYAAASTVDFIYARYFRRTRVIRRPQSGADEGQLRCGHGAFMKSFERAPNGFKNEYMVRHMFNCFVYDGSFKEVKGDEPGMKWLRASDGRALSLDGYNEKLKIAFEYQGKGHYEDVYNEGDKYLYQRQNDEVKKDLCKKNGVELIVVHCGVPFDSLHDYVVSRLLDIGVLLQEAKYKNGYIPVIPEPDRKMDKVIVKTTKLSRNELKSALSNVTISRVKGKTVSNYFIPKKI